MQTKMTHTVQNMMLSANLCEDNWRIMVFKKSCCLHKLLLQFSTFRTSKNTQQAKDNKYNAGGTMKSTVNSTISTAYYITGKQISLLPKNIFKTTNGIKQNNKKQYL